MYHHFFFIIYFYFIILLQQPQPVFGDYGDFVDPTFECPAKTTCPIVCVATGTTCPSSLSCPNNTNLCNDGTCENDCTAANAAFDPTSSPCPSCMPIICPKVINYFDTCKRDYHVYYNLTSQCKREEKLVEYTLVEPPFILAYVLFTLISSAMFLWCAYNQRWCPIPESTQPLCPTSEYASHHHLPHETSMSDSPTTTTTSTVTNSTTNHSWTQTGYKGGLTFHGIFTNPIGMFLYYCMMLNLLSLNFILAILTYWYYKRPISPITGKKEIFQDDVNLLQAFEITWIVAFGLTFLVKWPPSILSLYLRRCLLEQATHVAIYTPREEEKHVDDMEVQMVSNFLNKLSSLFYHMMRWIFSDVHTPQGSRGEVIYCPVYTESNGSRYIIFRLRRYVYDYKTNKFEPGSIDIGTTLGDFSDAKQGLETSQVFVRRRLVGPNTIDIKKPFFLRTMIQEFSKPFYTYQLYMVWAWFPFNYYFMAIIQSTIIITGGLSVSFFLYRNERNLYRLSRVSGHVHVLRDESLVLISQDELVPGDVVEIQPGMIFADMIILSTEVVIVDESALTGESTPMTKTAMDLSESQRIFHPQTHKKYFLSAGTTCTEASSQSFALVLKTGSYTAKGELLRDVISFRRHKFKFDTQVNLVVLILACYGIFGFLMTIHYYKDHFAYEFFYGM